MNTQTGRQAFVSSMQTSSQKCFVCGKISLMTKPKEKQVKPKETDLSFSGLAFEEVLADLMQIKPVDNAELKKDTPKQKKKPTTKK